MSAVPYQLEELEREDARYYEESDQKRASRIGETKKRSNDEENVEAVSVG